jgi:ABC-type iron transport system FetAB permease component
MDNPPTGAILTWSNIGLALSFVLFDAALSAVYRLGLTASLLTAAFRCIIQLTVMGLVLGNIFKTQNEWAVAGLACMSFLFCYSSQPGRI